MKALTLWEPWATLCVTGFKRFETRPWSFPVALEGQEIAIHASKAVPRWAANAARDSQHIRSALCILRAQGVALAQGGVVGTVRLGRWFRTEDIRDRLLPRELEMGDYSDGRFAWELLESTRFPVPVPASGLQKLWNWEPPV